MSFSSFTIARATYAFVFNNMLVCAKILWLPLALMFALALAAGPHLLCLARAFGGTKTTAASYARYELEAAVWFLGFVIVFAVFSAMMQARLWRFILRRGGVTSLFPLHWGGDELRLLAVWLLKLVVLSVMSLVFLLLIISLLALAVGHGSATLPTLTLGLVATFLLTGWVSTRLSLAGPATIDVRHIAFAASWRATRHHVSRLRGVTLLLTMPPLIVLLSALAIFVATALPVSHGNHLPLTSVSYETAKSCARMLGELLYRLPVLLVFLYLIALFLWSLLIAASAIEYQIAKSGSGP